MAVSSVTYNKPILPRTTDTSDLGSNRASVYSGKGLSFDGVNDQVAFGALSAIPTTNDMAFSAYFSTTNTAVQYLFQNSSLYIATNRDSSGGAGNLSVYISSGSWIDTGVFVGDGKTHHLVISLISGAVSIYLDGELINSGSTRQYGNSGYNAFLGHRDDGSWWSGNMSNLKWFTEGLTASQVKELYQNPEKAVPTGVDATSLVLHFPMTEGNGSYLYNANQGALGTELISNGGFDETCQKWGTTDSTDVEIVNGKAIWTNAPLSGSFVKQPLDLELGKFYRVSFDYTSTAFNIFVNLGDTQQAVPLGNGRASFEMYYGSGDSSLSFQHGYLSASSATVDNVSVKEVVPNYYKGTISGATWVSGLPEPLPQTALMDWNKIDLNTTANSNDYYYGNITIGSSSGTIICRHIPYTRNDAIYYYGLGSNSTGYQRAIGSNSNKYWSVGYGTGAQDFTSNATVDLGDVTDISNSWDAAHNVTIHKNGVFIQTESKTLADITGTRSVYLYRSAWASGNEQGIIFWAYYDRKLTTKEINDVYTGAVEPTDVADLKYFFTKENGYSYNGVTLTKNGSFTDILAQQGSTSGKDVFGNTISKPRASGAYNFDGNSWAEVQDNASLDITPAMTMEAWINCDDISTTSYETIFAKPSGTTWVYPYAHYDLRVISTNVQWWFEGTFYIATYNVSLSGWNHLLVTKDGASEILYINGVQVATHTGNVAISASPYDLILGANTDKDEKVSAQIAQPRIYNRALTAEQVADNFNEKASTFGGTKVASELDAYIERTASDGATVEAHSCVINYLTELDKK